MAKRVGIIGAGFSGLNACKVLKEEGYNVKIIDKADHLGGIWDSPQCYPGAHLQAHTDQYSFIDFPPTLDLGGHPDGKQICEYLEAYALKFDLKKLIDFKKRVLSLERRFDREHNQNGWIMNSERTDTQQQIVEEFDYIVIATGSFTVPKIPSFPGQDKFKGTIIHSSQYVDPKQMKDKKVITLGFGKTAIDLACYAAENGKRTDMVFKNPHWTVADYIFEVLHFRFIFYARLVAQFLGSWKPNSLQRFLHYGPGKIIRFAFFKTLELQNIVQYFLWGKAAPLKPDHSIVLDLSCNAPVTTAKFYKAIHKGDIKPHRTNISSFTEDKVILANGESLDADLVILCTGYDLDISYLPKDFQAGSPDMAHEGVPLYRHVMNPNLPHLGFVGFGTAFIPWVVTEMQSLWLSSFWKNKIQAPNRQGMLSSIQAEHNWKNEVGLSTIDSSQHIYNCVGPYMYVYLDQLLTDFKVSPYRRSNWFSEYFLPLLPKHFADVKKEMNGEKKRPIYISLTMTLTAVVALSAMLYFVFAKA